MAALDCPQAGCPGSYPPVFGDLTLSLVPMNREWTETWSPPHQVQGWGSCWFHGTS